MVIWVKKIVKIFRTMQMLEKSKTTKPVISSEFTNLIECLKTGAYQSLLDFQPLSSVIEHSELSSNDQHS